MATLSGTTPAATYPALIKFNDNSAISASLRLLSDGAGGATPLYLSASQINIGGTGTINATLGIKGISALDTDIALSVQSNVARMLLQVDNSGTTRISGATARFLVGVETGGIGGHRLVIAGSSHFSPSGAGNAGAFSIDQGGTSSASRTLYYDGSGAIKNVIQGNGNSYITSGNLGIGTATPTTILNVKGTGTTSATTSLLVENSSGTEVFKITDNAKATINSLVVSAGSTLSGTTYIYAPIVDDSNLQRIYWNTNELDFFTNGSSSMRITKATKNVLIGTTTDIASSKLTIDSTTQGILPPRMTTIQKNAIATPAAGLIVYDTTLNKLCVYTTAWETITSI